MTKTYQEAIDWATAEYQPLIDAIKAATGLDSVVWQSGGMTMTLWTKITVTDDPYEGYRYWSLVEDFGDDGKMAGSTSYYLPTDENEGTDVLSAYDAPLTASEWAAVIAAHQKSLKG